MVIGRVLFALHVGVHEPTAKWWTGAAILRRDASPATIGAVLEQAQQQIAQRRSEPIPPRR